jgi:hypothetical protein
LRWVPSWISRGHLTTPPLTQWSGLPGGLEATCCRWIRSMLESRLVHAFLSGSSMAARVAGGCPQGEFCLLSCGILLLMSYWPA